MNDLEKAKFEAKEEGLRYLRDKKTETSNEIHGALAVAIDLALKKGAELERKKCREEYALSGRIDISCDDCKKEKGWYNYCPKCRLKLIKNQFNFGYREGEEDLIVKVKKLYQLSLQESPRDFMVLKLFSKRLEDLEKEVKS